MRDTLVVLSFGLALVTAAYVYAATGWALPILIDKTGDT